jgi:hypothetical protein
MEPQATSSTNRLGHAYRSLAPRVTSPIRFDVSVIGGRLDNNEWHKTDGDRRGVADDSSDDADIRFTGRGQRGSER